jgi:putative copper export protein
VTELAKALLFTGVTLLVAADALRLYLAPGLRAPDLRALRRAWALGLAVGGLLVVGASFADVLLTLRALLGSVPWARVPEYLSSTVHGQAVLARVSLTVLLLAARFLPGHRLTFPVLAALLLASVTWTSHAGASGQPLLVAADALHLGAAALWVGSLLYLAWLPVWTPHGRPALERGLSRLSGLGVAYVGLLALTGVYASLYHLDSPASLLTTPYGRALAVKLLAVAVALGLAALNRWRFLPALRARGATRGLRTTMRLESLVLLLVLLVTGVLVSREPG